MVMSDDTDREVWSLELVLELAERGLPAVTAADRRLWVEACVRVRRLVLELRSGLCLGVSRGVLLCDRN